MYAKFLSPLVGAAFFVGSGLAVAQAAPETTPQGEPTAKSDSTKSDPAKSDNTAKTDDTAKSDGTANKGSTANAESAKMTLTEAQAKSWIDKPVYSSDGKEIGEVVAFKRGPDNAVLEMHADIGGTLGMGENRVKVMPQQFELQDDRIVLEMTESQAKDLPKIES
jgi:hypothetical protein